ncbi:MAG: rhomboid family intramembrane serine protease [Kiritimatiellia bacterium]|jgi:GlpG protein|nr:rhomboid family intramembrane serine protease [Kiritimatiellia bacterium]
MRAIGYLTTEEQAQTFADYLYVHDIEAELEADTDGAVTIWVVEEERVDEAKGLLSRFRSMPDAEEFHQATLEATERRREEKKEEKQEKKKLKRPGAVVWQMKHGGLTMVLMVVSIIVALLTRFGQDANWIRWLAISSQFPLDNAPFWQWLPEVAQGQVWRLVTPIFLHFHLWHLVFNLLWLKDLGGVMEQRIGTWRFAAAVLLMALVSNVAQFVMGGPNFGGMSGVVYGVFGYLWVRNRLDFQFAVMISPVAAGLLMVFLALGLFGLLGPTANTAHFSGLLAGAALGWLAANRPRV